MITTTCATDFLCYPLGVPEIEESFGPIDPMRQEQLVFKQDNSDVATLSANLTDMLIRGFGKMLIKESK